MMSLRICFRLLVAAALLVLTASFAAAQCEPTSSITPRPLSPLRPIINVTVKIPGWTFNQYGTLVPVINTYEFEKVNDEVYITLNGQIYTDNPITNPDGLYTDANAHSIYNSLCLPSAGSGSQVRVRPRSSAAAADGVSGEYAGRVAVADFNGDGIPDSAVIVSSGFTVNIFGANGQPTLTSLYPVANIGASIVAADFENAR
jgi:hypothetical protein